MTKSAKYACKVYYTKEFLYYCQKLILTDLLKVKGTWKLLNCYFCTGGNIEATFKLMVRANIHCVLFMFGTSVCKERAQRDSLRLYLVHSFLKILPEDCERTKRNVAWGFLSHLREVESGFFFPICSPSLPFPSLLLFPNFLQLLGRTESIAASCASSLLLNPQLPPVQQQQEQQQHREEAAGNPAQPRAKMLLIKLVKCGTAPQGMRLQSMHFCAWTTYVSVCVCVCVTPPPLSCWWEKRENSFFSLFSLKGGEKQKSNTWKTGVKYKFK